MRIKQTVIEQFNDGELSISMDGCNNIHFYELFEHLLFNSGSGVDIGFRYYHKIKGDPTVLAYQYQPPNKNCIHYSQIWEQDEEIPDEDLQGIFYVFLPGKQTPQHQYTLHSEATKEAERLCKKEKQIAYVCEVRVIVEPLDEVKITYR